MTILEELREFLKSIIWWVYFFLGFTVFFFTFGLKQIQILGTRLFLPIPTSYSFAVQFFKYLQKNLLPSQVEIVVLNPLNAFLTQIMISLSLSFIITLPILLYGMIKFISPGLYKTEKKAVSKIVIFSVILFILGSLFSYFFLVPSTFKILYSFALTLGASPLFTAYEFVSLTFILTIVVGIMFQVPIFMVLLSNLGFVSSDFWKNNCKYIFLAFLIFSAIITPDGTGITMLILFFPLAGLYLLGYSLTIKKKKKSNFRN
jgi:sec-independent protein translocase protein TatC